MFGCFCLFVSVWSLIVHLLLLKCFLVFHLLLFFLFLMNLLLVFTCIVYELSHWSVHIAFRVCVVGYFTFRSEQPFHYSN